MDLFAYSQIESLDSLVKKNGINVSRCRGYRLMKEEKPVLGEELDQFIERSIINLAEDAVCSIPRFGLNSFMYAYDANTRRLKRKYLVMDDKGRVVGIRWDKIHGKHRRNLKFLIKKKKRHIMHNISIWNKYCGKNVLYIHAKLGSCNWSGEYGTDYSNKKWYLDCCDDVYDNAYCDIYAKINNV